MAEHRSDAESHAQVQAHLHAIAKLLREAHRLGPEAQVALADLVDELGRALDATDVPNDEVARLSECATHLVQAVHEEEDEGILTAAKDRLDHAAVAIESKAPALANLARRVAEMLANLGI